MRQSSGNLIKLALGLLLLALLAFASGAWGQIAIPTDTPGLGIPQIYYLNITNIRAPGLLVVPKISRTNAGERPYSIEPGRGSFSATLGNLMSTDNNSWLGVGHDTFGVKFVYTFNMGLPFWMGASGNTGATPTITTAPYDWNSTNEACIAVGGNAAFTSANGDCFLKEFTHYFMQKTCGVTTTPATPKVGQCKVNFFELGNEVNSSGFWSDTPAALAKVANDEATIIRQYCGDCMILTPSVSAGGDGFAPNFAAGGGQFDNALGQVLDAWHAISGASLPDAVSFHSYPNHTNVAPPAFPETFVSHSDTKCTAANTPNSACRTALKDQIALVKAVIAARSWLAAKNPPIFNTETGWNGNSTISVDTQSVTYVDGGGTKTATIPGPITWKLRQAWLGRWFLFTATSGAAVNLPYQADNDCYDSMIAYGDTGTQRNHGSCTSEPVLLPLDNTFTHVAGGTITPDTYNAGTGLRGLLPTGYAFNTLVSWLHSAVVTQNPTNVSGDIWTMNYTDSAGKACRIVWNTNWLVTEPYANSFTTATDLNGTSSTISGGTLTIENRPIRLTGTVVAPTTLPAHAVGAHGIARAKRRPI